MWFAGKSGNASGDDGTACLLLACPTLIGLGTPLASADVTGGSLGTPFVYGCSEGNPPSVGDTWYNAWADNGNIYATSDDSSGFAVTCQNGSSQSKCPGGGSNLVVNEIQGADREQLSSSFTNCMTSYGLVGSVGYRQLPRARHLEDRRHYFGNGTLYLVVSRQSHAGNRYPSGYQATEKASIIKLTDHGRTWTNTTTTATHRTARAVLQCHHGALQRHVPQQKFANIV